MVLPRLEANTMRSALGDNRTDALAAPSGIRRGANGGGRGEANCGAIVIDWASHCGARICASLLLAFSFASLSRFRCESLGHGAVFNLHRKT